MDIQMQDDFILRSYDSAGARETSVDIYELVASMSRLKEAENIEGDLPLESKRERATTRLKKAGMIERVGRGWMITEAGANRLSEIEDEYQATEDFMHGLH